MSFDFAKIKDLEVVNINGEPYPIPEPVEAGLVYNDDSLVPSVLPNGTEGQLLAMGATNPQWVDPSDEIPDPLLVDNINEKTEDEGVTINGTVNIQRLDASAPGIGFTSDTTYQSNMNSYLEHIATNLQFVQANTTSRVIFTAPRTSFVKVGNMVTMSMQGQVAASTTFNANDYLLCNTDLPAEFKPLTNSNNIMDLAAMTWRMANGTPNNNAVLRFDNGSGSLIIQNTTGGATGNFNSGDEFNIFGISASWSTL